VSHENAVEINSDFDVPIVVGNRFSDVCGNETESFDADNNANGSRQPGKNGIASLAGNVEPEDREPQPAEIILEQTAQHPPRITSLCRLAKGQSLTLHKNTGSIEALVLAGACNNKQAQYERGSYLRFPVAVDLQSKDGCLLFVKQNQFLEGDDGQRHILIYDEQNWMPGPTDEMLIKPLHVFGGESIMVLRWKQACEFRPNLNPNGEEILVLDGLLQNRDHLYRPLSWIRNPVPDWRDWHGSTDTYLYYKSGHFPK
jgi:hypothetical protein